jgi:hypothetical protein
MNFGADCVRAEVLAGAIALGEAGDTERHAYRAHLSTCQRCLQALGGEREIERAMSLVAQARDQEHWEPHLSRGFARARTARRAWRWGAVLAGALVVMLASRAALQKTPIVVHGMAAPADVAALSTQIVPRREHSAESLAFAPAAGAVHTMTFQVSFDSRGRPSHCTVAPRFAHAALGAAVCAAVMRTR